MSEQSTSVTDTISESDETENTSEKYTVSSDEDLLGGLGIETTKDIEVPDKLVNQVIGQEHAQDIIKKAAEQHRHVMMIGSPGTGKSMLAKSMTELLPKEHLQDILIYPNPDDDNNPKVRTVPAGKGKEVVNAHKQEVNKKNQMKSFLKWIIIAVVVGYALLIAKDFLLGLIAAGIVYLAFKFGSRDEETQTPNLLVDASEEDTAPFEDATGAHQGALLGDVRHDPFQSSHMKTPAHERVEAGSIHKSNKGVLFIDEINTLSIRSQQKLMTAIQEGEFSITGQSERSSGAMVQTEPVPTDFILVCAGNMDAMENMHPALRDRIRGYGYEVYFDDTIEESDEMKQKYARFVAQEVEKDGSLPHFTRDAVKEIILEAKRRAGRKNHLTLKLRDLGGLVRVAGDVAKAEGAQFADREHVVKAKDRSRSIEQQVADEYIEKRKEYETEIDNEAEIGKVNGLAVMGDDSGILLPVEGDVTPAHGEPEVIATGKLQDIAEEAVENVSALIKKIHGESLSNKDIHVQFIQTHEGVQGDSASVTVATAVLSSLQNIAVKGNVAMTGSLSVRGKVLPVGGVTHKIEAAAKAGMDKVIIPKQNEKDVMIEEEYKDQVEIIPARNIKEVLENALENSEDKTTFIQNLESALYSKI